jgi:hypothetical protein
VVLDIIRFFFIESRVVLKKKKMAALNTAATFPRAEGVH